MAKAKAKVRRTAFNWQKSSHTYWHAYVGRLSMSIKRLRSEGGYVWIAWEVFGRGSFGALCREDPEQAMRDAEAEADRCLRSVNRAWPWRR